MGHKVHPMGFRIGVIRDWQAKWYADKHYPEFLHEDLKIRQAIQSWYTEAGVSQVEIHRQANKVSITIYTARPGILIGRGGQRVDEMRLRLDELTGKRVQLNIQEVRQPELDAYLVAKIIAEQIGHRVAYRRAMKQAILRTIQAGAKGIRISCAGRLGGAEIARRQTTHQGQVPLHKLRADIDYGFAEAHTTLGRIGVKVWIYKGDVLPEPKAVEEAEEVIAEPAISEGLKAKPSVPTELVEAQAEPVAEKSAEVAPAVKTEEKPAKPRRRRKTKAEVPAKPEEEKPAKPRQRRKAKTVTPAEPGEDTAKPAADITTEVEPTSMEKEVTPAVKTEEKPAKPRGRRKKDVTTEASEIPQES
jgi:small subunit ribosomal protein S3